MTSQPTRRISSKSTLLQNCVVIKSLRALLPHSVVSTQSDVLVKGGVDLRGRRVRRERGRNERDEQRVGLQHEEADQGKRTCTSKSHPRGLNRAFLSGQDGYVDGAVDGREASLQAGFNQGYLEGAAVAAPLGRLKGMLRYDICIVLSLIKP